MRRGRHPCNAEPGCRDARDQLHDRPAAAARVLLLFALPMSRARGKEVPWLVIRLRSGPQRWIGERKEPGLR